jgi:chorismate--pyruvate lyase
MQVPYRTNQHVKLAACSAIKPAAVPHTVLAHPPHWLTAAQLHPAPAALQRDWLFDQDSLTRRLTALSNDRFSVLPLHEGWQILRQDETSALGVPAKAQGWVREVFLRGNDQTWVFARSVAARSALEGSGLALDQLGSRSLGELLFSDRAFLRGELEVTRYPANWLPDAVRHEQLWARRSCFRRGELAVLVAEVFLPALWQAAGED